MHNVIALSFRLNREKKYLRKSSSGKLKFANTSNWFVATLIIIREF